MFVNLWKSVAAGLIAGAFVLLFGTFFTAIAGEPVFRYFHLHLPFSILVVIGMTGAMYLASQKMGPDFWKE